MTTTVDTHLFAWTAPGFAPSFISVRANADDVEFIVRSHANRMGACGPTAAVTLPTSELVALSEALTGFLAQPSTDLRQEIVDLIHSYYDPAPEYVTKGWDDGSGIIADKILALFAANKSATGNYKIQSDDGDMPRANTPKNIRRWAERCGNYGGLARAFNEAADALEAVGMNAATRRQVTDAPAHVVPTDNIEKAIARGRARKLKPKA